MQILIGADPEMFIQNPNSGAFISAFGMIQGTKHEPFPVPDGAVQVDGLAAEFNINPATSADDFCRKIQSVRDSMASMVPGFNLVADPVAEFDPKYFEDRSLDEKALGCDPDFNGWTGEVNVPPDGDRPWRTGAGHIHIGWTEDQDVTDPMHFSDCRDIAKQLDYYVGIHSLLWDPDARRRQMYGKAAAFRPKPYGVEYRTLSNRWLSSEYLTRWVYEATVKGVDDYISGKNRCVDKYGATAQHIIDKNNLGWQTQFTDAPFGTELQLKVA